MTIPEFYKTVGVKVGEKMELNDRYKFVKFAFETFFKPRMIYSEKHGWKVDLSDTDKEIIEDFTTKKVKAKTIEWAGTDDKKRVKREMTGASIEFGLLKFYGHQEFMDVSIVKNSRDKSDPDLLNLGIVCDIKGSSFNSVPMVFKSSRPYICKIDRFKGKQYKCSNIIGVTDCSSVWLLGVATPTILSKYSDTNLIKIADAPTKTGFYGAMELLDLPKDWGVFRKLCFDHMESVSS
jgi:hypothetical protein